MAKPKHVKRKGLKTFARGALPAALLMAMPAAHASGQRGSSSRRGTKAATTVHETPYKRLAENPFAGFTNNRALKSPAPLARVNNKDIRSKLAAAGLLTSQGRAQSLLSGDVRKKRRAGAKGGYYIQSCVSGATYNGDPIDNYRFSSSSYYSYGTYFCYAYSGLYSSYCASGTYIPGYGYTTSSCSLTNATGVVASAVSNPAQCSVFLAACTTGGDTTPPTPTLSGPVTTQNGPFTVNIDFGEDVTGFVLGDITVGNGSPSALMDNGGGSFSVTITPAADGPVTVDINAMVAADLAGNDNLAAMQFSVLADITGPTPVITGPVTTQNGAFSITIDFGEPVTGFALGDLTVGNGVASGLMDTGGGSFTATITPTADGTVTVDVNAATATDGVGNDNVAAMQFSVMVDTTAPTPTFVDPGLTQVGGPFTLQIDFGEVVTGFDLGDIMVVNGTPSNLMDLGGGLFSVTITPSGTDMLTVDVPGGAATDGAGNPSAAMPSFVLGPAVPAVAVPVAGGWFSVLLAAMLALFGRARFRRERDN